MTGFFRRVSRYAQPALYQLRENRLTEVFAAVLEQAPRLSVALARDWLSHSTGSAPGLDAGLLAAARAAIHEDGLALRSVRTQCFTGRGKFVDLELRFARGNKPPSRDIIVWVEVKHGSDTHEFQLDNYLMDLRDAGVGDAAVVLLAPRALYRVPRDRPKGVPLCTWQRTADVCRRWVSDADDDVARFLVGELLVFLEEEKLMDAEFTAEDFAALERLARVQSSIERVCQVASAFIAREWNCNREKSNKSGLGYFETHPRARPGQAEDDWTRVFWDWNLLSRDLLLPEPHGGVPVFTAGIGVKRPGVIVTDHDAEWATPLRADGFVDMFGPMNTRFLRFAYPETVLKGDTLEAQGENLGAWVVETYEAVHKAGPPPGLSVNPAGPSAPGAG